MFAETSARCGFTSLAISTVIGRCGSIHSGFGSAIQTCHKEAPGRAPRASGLPKYPPAPPRRDAPQRPRTAPHQCPLRSEANRSAALPRLVGAPGPLKATVPTGADGGREFLFLVADIPDADYFARCVLDRVITGHVRFAEDVGFAVERLTFVDIRYRFSLRVQDGPKRPAVYAARHIGGYADIVITRLYEQRSCAASLSLDLVDNREVVVHLG